MYKDEDPIHQIKWQNWSYKTWGGSPAGIDARVVSASFHVKFLSVPFLLSTQWLQSIPVWRYPQKQTRLWKAYHFSVRRWSPQWPGYSENSNQCKKLFTFPSPPHSKGFSHMFPLQLYMVYISPAGQNFQFLSPSRHRGITFSSP